MSGYVPTFENTIFLQIAKTDSNVLGVENLLSSSEVIVRFIRREGSPHFGLSIFMLIKSINKEG